ncbi:hypothetical protein O3M35_009591 [Rhynocoris fuscipes]|uniref:Peptidase S1 domain-containing protein n=1 Tax=Rhynocoris fuscipes TaxID=488301 RepID=A0AAW1D9E6_9HEMI
MSSNYQVIAGSTNFTRFDPRAQVRKIKKIIVHEGYRPGGYLGTDDIAIVELSYPLYENIRIKTLNLPTRYMLNNGTNFAVISSSTLDAEPSVYGTIVRFKIYIVPNFACACNDSVHDLTTIYDEEGNVIARFICFHYYEVGGGENPHIHCKDAAGGPLTIDDTLIAIQTGQYHVDGCKKNEKGQFERIPCDNTSTEAGYLQIYSYIDWINKYIPRRKATLRRPRTTVKNYHIDIKPLLPLILCAALYFIIIMIVLVCCLGILPKLN